MIRLVALDIDGTLFDSQGRLPPANGEAVRQALDKGVIVTLATARAYRGARQLADELGITAPLICHNGAMVKGGQDEAELLHLKLDIEAAREIVAFSEERDYRLFTTIDSISYIRPRPDQNPQEPPPGIRFITDLTSFITSPPTSILALGDDAVREIPEQFSFKYRDKVRFTTAVAAGFSTYLVIINSQAGKGEALLMLCQKLGIDPAEAMVMGDSETDISMIKLAGLGIAMGNAPPAVQDAAKYVAPTSDEDGVAWALRKFVL